MHTLRKRIDEKNMTIYEVSKLTGISIAMLGKYADSEVLDSMPLSIAFRLSKLLDSPVEELFTPLIHDKGLENGWIRLNEHLSIYIEDWQLIKGIQDGKEVEPYLPSRYGGFDPMSGISISDFKKVYWLETELED